MKPESRRISGFLFQSSNNSFSKPKEIDVLDKVLEREIKKTNDDCAFIWKKKTSVEVIPWAKRCFSIEFHHSGYLLVSVVCLNSIQLA